jgi:hypothetical protein
VITDDKPPVPSAFDEKKGKPSALDSSSLNFARRLARLRRDQLWAGIISLSSCLSSLPVLAFRGDHPGYLSAAAVTAIHVAQVSVMIGGIFWSMAAGRALGAILEDAIQSQDKRKIGVLLHTFQDHRRLGDDLHTPNSPNGTQPHLVAMARTLAGLLPQIEAEDTILFSPAQRKILRSLLRNAQSDVVLGALKALGKIGDSADLPMIQRVAQGGWKAAEDPHLVPAAKEAVAQIEARLSGQNQTETLLRHSAGPKGEPMQLLRPVAPQPNQTDTQQLLRAGNGEQEHN